LDVPISFTFGITQKHPFQVTKRRAAQSMPSLPTAFKKSTPWLVSSLARLERQPHQMTATEMFDMWHFSLRNH
jgi:hypothetical protein